MTEKPTYLSTYFQYRTSQLTPEEFMLPESVVNLELTMQARDLLKNKPNLVLKLLEIVAAEGAPAKRPQLSEVHIAYLKELKDEAERSP